MFVRCADEQISDGEIAGERCLDGISVQHCLYRRDTVLQPRTLSRSVPALLMTRQWCSAAAGG